jgi:hypothetical protein
MNAPTSNLDRASLRALLAIERDIHRCQRELVRASLLFSPDERAGSRVGQPADWH